MPVKKRAGKGSGAASSSTKPKLPIPFKKAPDSLEPFFDQLDIRDCYITHIDNFPASFKRKIFSVPVLLNLGVVVLFMLRVWYISPFYAQLFESAIVGKTNATTLVAKDMPWPELLVAVLRRGFTFMLDLVLAIFVWPWPVEFCFGTRHGNPIGWRLKTGFRDQEVYVRRSREWYSSYKTAVAKNEESIGKKATGIDNAQLDFAGDEEARRVLMAHIMQATSPKLTQQKTGYLTMDGNWDLDWNMMVWASHLVDKKEIALEAFTSVALVYHEEFGWLTMEGTSDRPSSGGPADDERRRQVFKFRDALSALGKEDLFYRWIEIIQFETTRPGGIGDSKRQEEVAKQVREEFMAKGVDFDKLWADTVGTDGLYGM
ncbi:hypothetical protein F503_03855 [Ophiostoma piceae UAMH 11346]|uniref:Uncharacterized protein n=1 Tax=Ophiostoma piceae (strain UAMH 11346) TaxID=1262450 RepID=S3CWS2_OPHP1|nr:hypothetical protein F503_03855 [Ophiostoma piceae UAMH 11346]